MHSPNDDLIKDNALILMSLIVTRFVLRTNGSAFPPKVKSALHARLARLIKRYRDPSTGVSYEDPEDYEETYPPQNH